MPDLLVPALREMAEKVRGELNGEGAADLSAIRYALSELLTFVVKADEMQDTTRAHICAGPTPTQVADCSGCKQAMASYDTARAALLARITKGSPDA